MNSVIINNKTISLVESTDLEFINFYNYDQFKMEYQNCFKEYSIELHSWKNNIQNFNNIMDLQTYLKTYNLPIRCVINMEIIDTNCKNIKIKTYPIVESA